MASDFISKLFKKDNLLPPKDLSLYNESILKLKEIEDSFEKGSIDKALSTIEKFYNELLNSENSIPLLVFDTLSLYIKFLIFKAKFSLVDELLAKNNKLIQSVESSKDKTVMNRAILFNMLLSMYYYRKGNFEDSEHILEKVADKKEYLSDLNLKLLFTSHLASKKLIFNDFKSAIDLLQQALTESSTNQVLEKINTVLNNNLGLAYLYSGNLTESYKYLNIAKQLATQSKDKILESLINSNIGLYNMFTGDIQNSTSNLEKNLEFYQQFDFEYELANTYINLSSLSEIKGEIVRAQSDLTSALDICNSIHNEYYKYICNNNFGNLALITGEFESAKNTYNESLEFFKKHNLNFDSINTLFNLLSLAVLENDSEAKVLYLKNISEIKEKIQNDFINLIFQVSKALDLKQNDRMVKKAEAQQIFLNIANNERLVNHEFKVIALKNLCELLIEELSETGEQEVIDELKDVLGQILSIAEKQNSLILRVESYLIQSKVDLLELKLNESRSLLGQAQTIAEEKGLTALAIFVSREYDNLLNQIAKFQDQPDTNFSNLSMNERLELAELENMVNKIIRKRAEIPEIKSESPFMFLIIAMSGMSIFSKIFVEENLMDEQLIGGFITAINIVTQQAFSDQDAIEGIRHQDFTLLLKYLGTTRILCVYVFKGQTYFAMQKLKTFIETVQYSEAMPLIDEANDIGKIVSEEPALLDIVTKIFQESNEDSLQLAKRNFFSQKVSSTINHGLLCDDVFLFN